MDKNELDILSNILLQKLEGKIEEIIDRKLNKNSDTMTTEKANIIYQNYLNSKNEYTPLYGEQINLFDETYVNESGYPNYIITDMNGKKFVVDGVRNSSQNMTIREQIRRKEIDFDNYKVKSRVGEILEEQGKTQTWLCSKTEIPKSTMYGIINNANAISLENAYKISMVLNIPLETLFPFENSKK